LASTANGLLASKASGGIQGELASKASGRRQPAVGKPPVAVAISRLTPAARLPGRAMSASARPWALAEQNHAFVRSQSWEVAVLPFGATEPHNLHMPYGTDNYQVEAIADRACRRAYDAGARVVLLPLMPFGVNTNHLQVPGALACSVTPTTLLHLLTDLVDSLQRQGLRKLVLLNGHGGNELKPLTRELHHRTGVFLCVCDWFRMAVDQYAGLFEQPGEHADEVETSLGLAFFPDLVHPELADDGAARPSRFQAINRGWVSITRPWHLVSKNTGLGNPAAASADKGRRLMELLTERLATFLVELSAAALDDTFPY
jgi:creatinine amidohydrolase